MAFQLFEESEESSLNVVMVSVIAEITLICATSLLFFAYLQLPTAIATAASLFIFFTGTLFCWRGFASAQGVFFLSIMVSELVLINFFDWLLAGFLVFDFIAIVVFMKLWQPKSDEPQI